MLIEKQEMASDSFDLPFVFVDSPETLAAALPALHDADLISVDAEFSLTGMHHCVLALLQVATYEKVWLIDPLAIPSLIRPLLLALAETPWIVHDYSGDGIVFKRIYDVVPASVLDTMMLAKALNYAQPGLKAMAKIKLGIDIPKEEQDSNWLYRPLRESQMRYAARDAALLLPLLRELAMEAGRRTSGADIAAKLAALPTAVRHLLEKIDSYVMPIESPLIEKIRAMELGPSAEALAKKLLDLRHQWGNEGDIAAVMELGNRWIAARMQCPPKTKAALEKTIRNWKFCKKRIDSLWKVFTES
jgi:ribonuclease D